MTTRVHTPQRQDTAWMNRAACRTMDLRKFFPDRALYNAYAIDVRNGCPVREQCLEYDMQRNPSEMWGVYGGLTDRQRRSLHRTRQRAAQERAAS
jgi:WhiB family transcriptional regulator, redox-sensing transcriptional regulator